MNAIIQRLVPVIFAGLASSALALDHGGQEWGSWRAVDSPHRVLTVVTVPAGQSLDIEAGAIVTFAPGTYLDVQGHLSAVGTSASPIAFQPTSPAAPPGTWLGLHLHPDTSTHALAFVDILGATEAIHVYGGTLQLLDSTLAVSRYDALVLDAGSAADLRRCAFRSNSGTGLVATACVPSIRDCVFTGNDTAGKLLNGAVATMTGCSASGNRSWDGFVLDTHAPFSGTGTLVGGGVPYVITPGQTYDVATGASLVVRDAILKLGSAAKLRADGNLTLLGQGSEPVLVTSAADDTAGGDTNRDGAATSPGKGDWSGIEVGGLGSAALLDTEIRYGLDGLRVYPGGQAQVQGCEIHHVAGRGLAFGTETFALVSRSSFHDDDIGIEVQDPAGIAMGLAAAPGVQFPGGGNLFDCNGAFHVANTSGSTLPAQRNWWGGEPPDPSYVSGPVDATSFIGRYADATAPFDEDLRVARSGADLALNWRSGGDCLTYRIEESPFPGASFDVAASALATPSWLAAGAASSPWPLLCYRVEVETP